MKTQNLCCRVQRLTQLYDVATLGLYDSRYNSVKHIRKLDTTRALLKNHNSSDFRFLDRTWLTTDKSVGRCRTMYYTTLSRILFAEDNMDADFWRFVKPWETTLDQVTRAFQFQGSSELSEEDIRVSLQSAYTLLVLVYS